MKCISFCEKHLLVGHMINNSYVDSASERHISPTLFLSSLYVIRYICTLVSVFYDM